MKHSKLSLTKLFLVFTLALAMTMSFAACGSGDDSADIDLTSLMEQVAASEQEKSYEDYLTDEVFANCELFGTEEGKAYVYLNTAEYVVLNDIAYFMSGGSAPAVISYEESDDGIKLTGVEWCLDGAEQDAWLEENFPEEILAAYNEYEPYDESGFLKLDTKMIAKAEENLGVTVERENFLTIDPETGKYRIYKTIEPETEDPEEYTFDTEVLEEGTLKTK